MVVVRVVLVVLVAIVVDLVDEVVDVTVTMTVSKTTVVRFAMTVVNGRNDVLKTGVRVVLVVVVLVVEVVVVRGVMTLAVKLGGIKRRRKPGLGLPRSISIKYNAPSGPCLNATGPCNPLINNLGASPVFLPAS